MDFALLRLVPLFLRRLIFATSEFFFAISISWGQDSTGDGFIDWFSYNPWRLHGDLFTFLCGLILREGKLN